MMRIYTDFSRIIALIFAFVCFILLATFPGWHTDENEEGSSVDVKVSQKKIPFLCPSISFPRLKSRPKLVGRGHANAGAS